MLLCPWDSPGKNTGVGCHALLHRTFPTHGSNPVPLHCRHILYHLSHQGSPEHWSGSLIPSSGDLPDPGIELGPPALQADSLPAELPRRPQYHSYTESKKNDCCCSLIVKLCLTLSDPIDCKPSGSSVHGILQARVLEWAAISSSRGSFQLRN